MPNGIVIIKIKQTIPARAYRMAIHHPHRTSQITFSISLMTDYYPL